MSVESLAKKHGVDGFAYKNEFEKSGGWSWVVFDPTQIKSATGNNGDFDPKSPVITKSHTPVVLFFKSHVGPYLRGGKIVNVAGYQGKGARAMPQPGQMSLFGGPESGKPLPPSPLKGKDPVANTPDMFGGEQDTAPEQPNEALQAALKRKDLAGAMAVLEPLSRDDTLRALLQAGFSTIAGSKTSKREIMAHVQSQLASAARAGTDGYAARKQTVTEPRADLIAEHERLVGVLESPSHADDKVEAKRQAKELAGYKKEDEKPVVFLRQPEPSASNLSNNAPMETKKEQKMEFQITTMKGNKVVAELDGQGDILVEAGGKKYKMLSFNPFALVPIKMPDGSFADGLVGKVDAGNIAFPAAEQNNLVKLYEAQRAAKIAALDAKIPGLSELRAAYDKRDFEDNRFRREQESEYTAGFSARTVGNDDLANLEQKYPVAYQYIRAEAQSGASNDRKSAAGRAAKNHLLAGGSPQEAAKMMNHWAPSLAEID